MCRPPQGLPHVLVSPRSLSEEGIPFPPTSILLLLACIFLSKFLAASALWAAAWRGQKLVTRPASELDCGHDPSYQLQTLTGEYEGHSGGWRWTRQGWRGGAQRRHVSTRSVAERRDT